MAESAWREGSTRRQSFRKNLEAAGLPEEDFERLEQKRKQLDESIHKYIAAKEREYKSFEKELIQRHKLGSDRNGSKGRRISVESNSDGVGSPRSQSRQTNQNAVDALLAAGVGKDQIGQPVPIAVVDEDGTSPTIEARPSMAGLTDRTASLERDREFIGVFTPAYLPALANGRGRGSAHTSPERAESAPPGSVARLQAETEADGLQRANSETAAAAAAAGQAKAKRPIHLQLSQRTSSSGSSENGNGKLPSALKSPTHRPRKKRVSLAINDTIVAPSDHVPESHNSNNSTPSHSRTRSPASERDAVMPSPIASPPKDSPQQTEPVTAPFSPLSQAVMVDAFNTNEVANRKQREEEEKEQQPVPVTSPSKAAAPAPIPTPQAPASIDGDLDFALDDDDILTSHTSRPLSPLESISSDNEDISGRPTSTQHSEDGAEEESDDHAEHLEFKPSSVQRTNTPGFRRPSATIDPVYMGSNYNRAERSAVNNETYGSSYVRPDSKGSFTAGSLGESFMARNAERMMRNRHQGEEGSVRS